MKVLPERFAKFRLEINAEKSKLVNFVRPGRSSGRGPDGRWPKLQSENSGSKIGVRTWRMAC